MVRRFGVLTLALTLALVACDDDSPTTPGDETPPAAPPEAVADVALVDVNPFSPTNGQEVGPRDQLGRVSAWYFGHAT